MIRDSQATKILLFIGISLSSRVALAAQLPVDELLKRVSGAYQGAQNYKIVAEKNVEVTAAGEANSVDGGRAYSNFHQSSNFEITLAASDSGKGRLTAKDEKQETVVVNDGHTSWTYISGKKQYTEEPSALPPAGSQTSSKAKSGPDILKDYENLLVNRFRNLSAYSSSATLEKDEKIKIGGEKRDCYHVRIQTGGGSHELWIDKDNFLVWRNKDSTPTPQEGITLQTTVTVNLRTVDLNAKFEDSFFTFMPPEKAKRVDSLKL